jgi:hypothetical protein
MVLNRPVFTQQRFSSAALTVLSTLIHRFTEAGTYQVAVTGSGTTRIDSLTVSLVGTHQQVNIDMAKAGNARGSSGAGDHANGGCCCEPAAGRDLAVGGVVAFYASGGTGVYTVAITRLGEREKHVVMDSSKTVPSGDLFAVTLVRPGAYRIMDEVSSSVAEAHVSIPERQRIDPEVVAMMKLGEGGFQPTSTRLNAGQSLVVECSSDARLVFELTNPEATAGSTRSGRYSFRRPTARN